EYQGRVWGNNRRAALYAVCKAWWNDQLPLAPDFHGHDAFVPALDYHPHSYPERQRLFTIVRAVEFLAILQCAEVVHSYSVAWLRACARADHNINILQSARSCDFGAHAGGRSFPDRVGNLSQL